MAVYLMQDRVTEHLNIPRTKRQQNFGKQLQSLYNFIAFLEEANKHRYGKRINLDILKVLKGRLKGKNS